MLSGALLMWFGLTFLSLIYLVYALIETPGPTVMKWAWVLIVLYTGPVGLFIYLLSCKEPFPGTHEQFIAYRWKQSVGSEIHCVAGDATGIIIAAVILSFFSISSATEMFIEYLAGFISGLFIFQALFMKNMMGGSYWKSLKNSFIPEWLSMNMIMAGMLPVMAIWRHYDPQANDPSTLSFWGSMSLATIIGGIIAYPINDWLVTNGLKHGMMTVRKPGDKIAKIVIEGAEIKEAVHHEHMEHMHHAEKPKVSNTKIVRMTILTIIALFCGAAIGLLWNL